MKKKKKIEMDIKHLNKKMIKIYFLFIMMINLKYFNFNNYLIIILLSTC